MSKTKRKSQSKQESLQDAIAKFWPRATKFTELVNDPPEFGFGSTEHEVVYQKDRMRLLYYSSEAKSKKSPPILMVYAVINKPYVLDLHPDRSVIGTFLREGFDVYLINWGTPHRSDKYISTEDYIERYIDYAVDWITESRDCSQISLLGYCLGGTLAAIYAAEYPDRVKNLMIMAAPIDFEDEDELLHWWTNEEHFDAEKLTKAYGNIPDYLFTSTFKYLDPAQNLFLKYVSLFENAQNDEFVDMFFRMEQWIHDGIPVTGAFYRELIEKWYQGNQIVRNEFRINGHKVNLRNISMPVATITGEKDHIAPPSSTRSLLEYVSSKDKMSVHCDCGHIGLSVGGRAHREVWPEVTSWLAERSEGN